MAVLRQRHRDCQEQPRWPRATSTARRRTTRQIQRARAVFDTANLLKLLMLDSAGVVTILRALFSRRHRLQLGIGDSNCAHTAEFLKTGTTALVIDMVEAGFLRDAPQVRRPVRALKRISKDPTLQACVAVKRGGSMSALEIQRWYLRRAEEFQSTQRVAYPRITRDRDAVAEHTAGAGAQSGESRRPPRLDDEANVDG